MRYSSDLTDKQWNAIKHLVDRPDPRGAKAIYERREIINAILYLNKTGCQWRMLPNHFSKWQNVYNHFRRMQERGVWCEVCWEFNEKTRSEKKREATPSYLLADSQSVKSNCEGEERGFHGGKKVKGRSRQIAPDTQGNVCSVHVHSANKSDTKKGCTLMGRLLRKLSGVRAICADKGYRGTFVKKMREDWGLEVHIPEREGNRHMSHRFANGVREAKGVWTDRFASVAENPAGAFARLWGIAPTALREWNSRLPSRGNGYLSWEWPRCKVRNEDVKRRVLEAGVPYLYFVIS